MGYKRAAAVWLLSACVCALDCVSRLRLGEERWWGPAGSLPGLLVLISRASVAAAAEHSRAHDIVYVQSGSFSACRCCLSVEMGEGTGKKRFLEPWTPQTTYLLAYEADYAFVGHRRLQDLAAAEAYSLLQ